MYMLQILSLAHSLSLWHFAVFILKTETLKNVAQKTNHDNIIIGQYSVVLPF